MLGGLTTRLRRVWERITRRLARSHLRERDETIARLRSERDRARHRVSVFERDTRVEYLFVLTYGRSGSTLVQGILNSIPGYLIRGENRQILRHVWAYDKTGVAERRVQRRKQRERGAEEGSSGSRSPLFGMDNYAHGAALRHARKLAVATILRPEPDTRVTGFKEILWGEPDTPDFVRWLQDVFPGAKFVINTRDLESVSHSAWWSKDPDALAELQEREAMLMTLRDQLGDAAYHIKYDEFTANPEVLQGLFEWLGEPFDLETVRSVLDVRHSFRPRNVRSGETDEEEAVEPVADPP